MEKKKGLVKQLHFIPPPYGGVSVYVKRLTDSLNNDGFVSGAYYIKGEVDDSIVNSPLYDSFEWLSTKRFLPRMIQLIKETKSYEIVHSHFSLEGMVFLWSLSVFCKKKIVVTIHNSWVDNFYISTHKVNRYFMKKLALRNVVWIAVSEEGKTKMEQLPVNFKNICVIPAFIPNDSEFDENEILSKNLLHFLSGTNKVIVFYGHAFINNNGVDVYGYTETLEMFGLLTQKFNEELSLVMCLGENNTVEIDKLKKMAEEKGLTNRIYWQIGAITNMNALWKYTDVYIRPTSSDGDSVAVREALSLGIKVVASNVCVRPLGVKVYVHNDIMDFSNKLFECLQEKNQLIYKTDYYKQMLSVYEEIHNK